MQVLHQDNTINLPNNCCWSLLKFIIFLRQFDQSLLSHQGRFICVSVLLSKGLVHRVPPDRIISTFFQNDHWKQKDFLKATVGDSPQEDLHLPGRVISACFVTISRLREIKYNQASYVADVLSNNEPSPCPTK